MPPSLVFITDPTLPSQPRSARSTFLWVGLIAIPMLALLMLVAVVPIDTWAISPLFTPIALLLLFVPALAVFIIRTRRRTRALLAARADYSGNDPAILAEIALLRARAASRRGFFDAAWYLDHPGSGGGAEGDKGGGAGVPPAARSSGSRVPIVVINVSPAVPLLPAALGRQQWTWAQSRPSTPDGAQITEELNVATSRAKGWDRHRWIFLFATATPILVVLLMLSARGFNLARLTTGDLWKCALFALMAVVNGTVYGQWVSPMGAAIAAPGRLEHTSWLGRSLTFTPADSVLVINQTGNMPKGMPLFLAAVLIRRDGKMRMVRFFGGLEDPLLVGLINRWSAVPTSPAPSGRGG